MITINVNANLRRNIYAQPKFDFTSGVIALEIMEFKSVYDGTNWTAIETPRLIGAAFINNSTLIDTATLVIDPSISWTADPVYPLATRPAPLAGSVPAYDHFMGLTGADLGIGASDKVYDKIATWVEKYLTANLIVC